MHFGPRHWLGESELLLEKLNSYAADIVFNTGDSTTDALETEFEAAGNFLKSIECKHIVSIPGNHDKRNMRSADYFREYIDDVDVIRPLNRGHCIKNNIFLSYRGFVVSFYYINIRFFLPPLHNPKAPVTRWVITELSCGVFFSCFLVERKNSFQVLSPCITSLSYTY